MAPRALALVALALVRPPSLPRLVCLNVSRGIGIGGIGIGRVLALVFGGVWWCLMAYLASPSQAQTNPAWQAQPSNTL